MNNRNLILFILMVCLLSISCTNAQQETGLVTKIKSLTDEQIKNGTFSGAVLVARKDKILYTACGGEANKSFHVPNKIDTKFNLGSMNKMFTAVAIIKLVEEGKLSLADPLSRYADESWLPKQMTDKITIEHLLTHSSGLGSYFNQIYMNSSRELFRDLNDYKPLLKEEKLQFDPGTKWAYSNTGMLMLGVVIEKVTGENYFDYIRKVIYEPAGMKNSDSYEMDQPVENLAIGYSPDKEASTGWRNNLFKHVIKGGPAGGGFSTVLDLHKFAIALLSEKYVSKNSLDVMWTSHLSQTYGFGFGIRETSIGKVVGHTGGFPGINSSLDIYIDSGYIVAVMSNYDRGGVELARQISQILCENKK